MCRSSIVSSMKRCQDARNSSVRRSISAGGHLTFIFTTLFPASTHSLVTQPLQNGSYSNLNIISKTRHKQTGFSMKCTLENGGGRCRYVSISTKVYCILNWLLEIPRATQARCNDHSNYN